MGFICPLPTDLLNSVIALIWEIKPMDLGGKSLPCAWMNSLSNNEKRKMAIYSKGRKRHYLLGLDDRSDWKSKVTRNKICHVKRPTEVELRCLQPGQALLNAASDQISKDDNTVFSCPLLIPCREQVLSDDFQISWFT